MNTQRVEGHTPYTDCIEWDGYVDKEGYGRVSHKGKWTGAHRMAWERINGKIPKGLTIDHLCRNRSCVNPKHLEVVTSRENTLRGFNPMAINARKKKCSKSHPLSGKNLYIDARGHRQCKTCMYARWRAYRLRKIKEGTWRA